MIPLTNNRWGDTRRKLEDKLKHIVEQLTKLTKEEEQIRENLRAFDEAVQALNNLPDEIQCMIQGKKFTSHTKQKSLEQSKPSQPTTPKPLVPPIKSQHNFTSSRGTSDKQKEQIILQHLETGPTNMREISEVSNIHYTEVSKTLNRLFHQNKVRFEAKNSSPTAPKIWMLK